MLVVTALQEEFEAARDVACGGTAGDPGVASWREHDEISPPYHLGEYRLANGGSLLVALARPVEKGGTALGAVAGVLAERLHPRCLAMSGVCAGNPAEVVLGDVIVASFAYRYQEGKQTAAGFRPDHRQTPAQESCVRAAQDLPLAGLSTNGPATQEEARRWVLECLLARQDPRSHSARSRYIADDEWTATLAGLESDGLITMPVDRPKLTRAGRALANSSGDWLISIFGDGGVGKTTLAYEMVKQHAWPAGFRRVAWVSAKFSHLRALGNVEYTRHADIGWYDLLTDIARQLDLRIQQNPVQMEERLAGALGAAAAAGPCVMVIDNLETVKEAELAMQFLTRPSVLRPHKVIITTRQSAQGLASEVREFSWRGLSDDAVLAFARHLASDDPGFELGSRDAEELIAMSAGIPLLVKMAVRLAMHDARPVTEVIDQVRDPHDPLGERVGLYLYEHAMDALAASEGVGVDAAADLMNVFCGRPSGESFTMTDFFELSLISDRKVFDCARAAARSLALIRGIDGNRRFTVHPLLREYVCHGARALS